MSSYAESSQLFLLYITKRCGINNTCHPVYISYYTCVYVTIRRGRCHDRVNGKCGRGDNGMVNGEGKSIRSVYDMFTSFHVSRHSRPHFLLRPKCCRIFSLPFAYAAGAHYGTPYSVVPIDSVLNGKLPIRSLSIKPFISSSISSTHTMLPIRSHWFLAEHMFIMSASIFFLFVRTSPLPIMNIFVRTPVR